MEAMPALDLERVQSLYSLICITESHTHKFCSASLHLLVLDSECEVGCMELIAYAKTEPDIYFVLAYYHLLSKTTQRSIVAQK